MDTLGAACLGRSCALRGGLCIASFLGLILGLRPESARAICDVIPGVTAEFRGALGTLNRPFSIPGDVGQQLTVTLDPSECDGASPGFLNLPGGTSPEDDYFVTVVFEPPNGGTRNAIVLTTSESSATCEARRTDALPLLGGGSATCRVVLPGTQELRVLNPTTLAFRFPDTDAELSPDDDDRTYTGPATIAVTPVSAALPFGLATARCADTASLVACIDELYAKDGTCGTAAANVDPVFGHFTALPPANNYEALCETAGTECDGTSSELRFTVDSAGNALVPVDWRGILLRPDGIPVPRIVRGATSLPAFAGGGPVQIPGRSFLASYAPSGRRVHPSFDPLLSDETSDLTLFGSADAAVGVIRIARRMPDLTNPLTPVHRECAGGANDGLPCVVAADCALGTCGATTCRLGGVDTGQSCTDDLDCTGGGECGPALFDFADRLHAGVGPVLVSSTDYALEAESPVPIEGLLETPSMFAFVQLEAIAGSTAGGPTPQDLNGDGDTTDAVLVLRDRKTGTITPIGTATNPGRAATRVHEPPFSAPAVAVEGDVAAFLESEPLQGNCSNPVNCDTNQDGDVFDSILRVYRLDDCAGTPCADDLLPTLDLAVDAAPLVGGQSVAVANGRVYFRASEAQNASQTTTRITSTPATPSYYPFLHGDGRHVTFTSNANMDPAATGCSADDNDLPDVYAFDRDSNGDGVFDDPATSFTRLSVDSDGCQGADGPYPDTRSFNSRASTLDGRFVTFISAAHLDETVPADDSEPFPPGPGNEWVVQADAYVRDRDVDQDGIFDEPNDEETRVIGLSSSGLEGNYNTGPIAITPDGRFVVLYSLATNLVPGDTNGKEDLFVRDLVTGTTVRVGVDSSCNQLDPPTTIASSGGAITDDGRLVGFVTFAQAAPEDTDTAEDVYLRDRDADEDGIYDECSEPGATRTSLLSLSPPEVDQNLKDSTNVLFSGDGSAISFLSDSTNLVPGDTNGSRDAFVKDMRTGQVTRVSVASDGTQQNATNYANSTLSRDGRYVVLMSRSSNLAPETTPDIRDVFVHDRVTGHTARVSNPVLGGDANADSFNGVFDGRFVAFESLATNLAGTDLNGDQIDVFVYGPDTADLANDFSGDGRLDDTVLYVLDTTAGTPTPVVLGPALDVSVAADGSAAFLRPEAADGVSCNGDGDLADACVFLSVNGAAPIALGREATAVAVTPELVAALVPDGSGSTFLQVWDRPSGPWSAGLGPAADSLDVSGSTVAFRAEGTGILHVYDHTTASETSTGQVAEDYVAGDRIVAFRTSETGTSGSLNPDADSDTNDDVIRVWDLVTDQLLEVAQAVTPCNFEACRPRRPYRVSGDNVTFLTLEADQGGLDLDGNGNANGIVIQTFNARKAAQALGGGGGFAPAAFSLFSGGSPEVITLAGVSAGVCTTTGEACSTDADCGGAPRSCFLPPGGCIQNLATSCNVSTGCSGGQFCVPTPGAGGAGFCHLNHGPCGNDSACSTFPSGTVCEDGDRDRVRLFAPLAAESGSGDQLLPSLEAGEGTCTLDAHCETDESCSPAGTCQPDQPELVTVGAPDTDADGVADDFDNCPRQANADQADENANDVGDVCDLLTLGPDCANLVDDDGDGYVDTADPGCSGSSDPLELSNKACDDGVDNDNDGFTDFDPDPGEGDPQCYGPTDNREKPKGGCGLGFEVALGLWVVAWWHRRRARRGR